MRSSLLLALIPLTVVLALPAAAQKTTQPQSYAQPGESTEPPRPHAAPVPVVMQHALPRAGGILVFGGAAGVGLDVATVLADRGERVTVGTTIAWEVPTLAELGVRVVRGDMTDPEILKKLFVSAPYRAVILSIGTGSGEALNYFEGNRALMAAAGNAGVPRILLVSAIGAGDSADALPWYAQLLAWLGRKDLEDRTRAEDFLRSQDAEYTVLRVGGVFAGSPGQSALLTDDVSAYGQIARSDLAQLIADCIDNSQLIGKTLSAFDPSRSGLLGLIGAS